ncbi:MAG: arylsulfatase A [Verrucomicrobiales bacterium]|jgi:arylsulfatase A
MHLRIAVGLLASSILLSPNPASCEIPDAPPNILLILADDLGYGDLGCYGAMKQLTPNLDRMAAEGMRFTDFYMSSPVCSPSRASILTGCYHVRLGINHVLWPSAMKGLNPDEVTIAEVLKTRGYETRYYGKWHVGDQKPFLPTRQGFDGYFGIPYSHDMPSLVRVKKDKGQLNPVQLRVLPLMRDEKVDELISDISPLMRRYVDELSGFMKASTEAKKPFFAMLSTHAVHLPMDPPKDFKNRSRNGSYGDWIEELDSGVGTLFEVIKELGIAENTLVIFTSDNGPAKSSRGTAYPLRGTKATTWEGGVRTPFIAWWPGKIRAGEVCREIGASPDILPTLASAANAKPAAAGALDGVDLLPLLFGQELVRSPRTDFVYYQGANLVAVREGPWKLHLISPTGVKDALYNLADDPGETNNLSKRHPDAVDHLRELADVTAAELGDRLKVGRRVRVVGQVSKVIPLIGN